MPTDAETPMKYIAIVGSISAGRELGANKALDEKIRQDAFEFGKELQKQGYGIVVYADYDEFVDIHVVRGYIDGIVVPKAGSIRLFTQSDVTSTFPIDDSKTPLPVDWLDIKTNSSPQWELSYYSSLGDAQGVLMLGGAQSTFVAGVLCLRNKWPILTIAETGGSAKAIWDIITVSPAFTADDANQMGKPFRVDQMDQYMKVLENQISARERTKAKEEENEAQLLAELARYRFQNDYTRQTRARSIAIIIFLCLSVASFAAVSILAQLNKVEGISIWGIQLLLVFCSISAGALGGVIRTVIDRRTDYTYRPSDNEMTVCALGATAGLVAGMLYVSTQILAGANNVGVVSMTALFIGLIAGLTTEKVFADLSKKNALDVQALAADMGQKKKPQAKTDTKIDPKALKSVAAKQQPAVTDEKAGETIKPTNN